MYRDMFDSLDDYDRPVKGLSPQSLGLPDSNLHPPALGLPDVYLNPTGGVKSSGLVGGLMSGLQSLGIGPEDSAVSLNNCRSKWLLPEISRIESELSMLNSQNSSVNLTEIDAFLSAYIQSEGEHLRRSKSENSKACSTSIINGFKSVLKKIRATYGKTHSLKRSSMDFSNQNYMNIVGSSLKYLKTGSYMTYSPKKVTSTGSFVKNLTTNSDMTKKGMGGVVLVLLPFGLIAYGIWYLIKKIK